MPLNQKTVDPKSGREKAKWTDVATVILTAIIAGAALVSAWIFNGQLTEGGKQTAAVERQMRQDQRAWVYIENSVFTGWKENIPVIVHFNLVNRGKTPAKQIKANFILEKLSADTIPTFTYEGRPRFAPQTGILVPGFVDPKPFEVQSARWGSDSMGQVTQPWLLSKTDVEELNHGRAWVVLYGEIRYNDIFGTPHWIKLCEWTSGRVDLVRSSAPAKACIDYNDADDN
jgi:hypothetical protein